jgi:hypothetical protein
MNRTASLSAADFPILQRERDAARSAGIPGLMACAHCQLLHIDPAIADDCSMTATHRGWVCSQYNGCAYEEKSGLSSWLEAA